MLNCSSSKLKRSSIFVLVFAFLLSWNVQCSDSEVNAATPSVSIRGDMNILDANGQEFSPDYSIVIKKDGSAWQWGGSRVVDDSLVVKKPLKILEKVKVVSSGFNHTLAVKTDGTVWGWGKNQYYQLGNGSKTTSEKPVKIMDGVVTVSAGANHSIALKKDGTLWGWGDTSMGQLGKKIPDEKDTFIKKPVKLMDGVAAISAGAYHTMIIKKDGSLWGTGGGQYLTNNGGSGIGNGDFTTHFSFEKVMDKVAAVSCGTLIFAAIRYDGTLWTWGNASSVPVKQLDNVVAVSTADEHILAIKKDQTLWAWGSNYSGQVGDGTTTYREKPVKIMDKVIGIAAGGYHSLAIKSDGSLYAWGSNYSGELGNGALQSSNKPIKIMTNLTVNKQSASAFTNDFVFSKVEDIIRKPFVNTLTDKAIIERLKAYPTDYGEGHTVDFESLAKKQPKLFEDAYNLIKKNLSDNKIQYNLKDTEFYTNTSLAYTTNDRFVALRGIIDGVDQEIILGWDKNTGVLAISEILELK